MEDYHIRCILLFWKFHSIDIGRYHFWHRQTFQNSKMFASRLPKIAIIDTFFALFWLKLNTVKLTKQSFKKFSMMVYLAALDRGIARGRTGSPCVLGLHRVHSLIFVSEMRPILPEKLVYQFAACQWTVDRGMNEKEGQKKVANKKVCLKSR